MPFLKLFSAWESFKEDGIVCHIFAPRKRAFSRPYPVVFGFGAKIFLPPRRVCLLKNTDDWYNGMDLGKLVGLVFIDLKKAFDTVDHSIPFSAKSSSFTVYNNVNSLGLNPI